MKYVFIINPTAGKKNRTREVMESADLLRKKHGCSVQCMLTKSPGHATQLARQLAETGEELRIFACGGDGTINEVANGVAGYDNVAMSCIPIGTGNDFLKNFGLNVMEQFGDPLKFFDGPTVDLDLIECNNKLALTIACSGIDARIARDVHKYGSSPLLTSKGSYVTSMLVNFVFKGIAQPWKVTLDDEVREEEFSLIAVCNGRHYGGGFMPVAEARMDDGVLNTLVVKKASRATFAAFVSKYAVGGYREFPKYAKCYTAKEITLHSDGEPICTCLDGETIENNDVVIRLSDKKLHFFGPVGINPNATYADKSL